MTAVALLTPEGKLRTRLALTRVSFLRLERRQIDAYVESREGLGKAGGYAIQGRAEIFVKEITGSYSNVVGLPLAETVALLQGCGCRSFHDRLSVHERAKSSSMRGRAKSASPIFADGRLRGASASSAPSAATKARATATA